MIEYSVRKLVYQSPDNLESMLNFLSSREGWQIKEIVNCDNPLLILCRQVE